MGLLCLYILVTWCHRVCRYFGGSTVKAGAIHQCPLGVCSSHIDPVEFCPVYGLGSCDTAMLRLVGSLGLVGSCEHTAFLYE